MEAVTEVEAVTTDKELSAEVPAILSLVHTVELTPLDVAVQGFLSNLLVGSELLADSDWSRVVSQADFKLSFGLDSAELALEAAATSDVSLDSLFSLDRGIWSSSKLSSAAGF